MKQPGTVNRGVQHVRAMWKPHFPAIRLRVAGREGPLHSPLVTAGPSLDGASRQRAGASIEMTFGNISKNEMRILAMHCHGFLRAVLCDAACDRLEIRGIELKVRRHEPGVLVAENQRISGVRVYGLDTILDIPTIAGHARDLNVPGVGTSEEPKNGDHDDEEHSEADCEFLFHEVVTPCLSEIRTRPQDTAADPYARGLRSKRQARCNA